MITDKKLAQISLLISVAGIIALFFLTQTIEPLHISISEIDESTESQKIVTQGNIQYITTKNGNTLIILEDNNYTINIISFKKQYQMQRNTKILVTGTVQTYKGEMEIIADSIHVIR